MISPNDPVKMMELLLSKAKGFENLAGQLSFARTIHETAETTCARLLEERAAVVKFLMAINMPRAEFDWDYKENMAEVFRELTQRVVEGKVKIE